jgi:O-antigen/teichoic acid export membrane protein
MQIGKKDIAWNFIATFMRVASGLIVLPLVLHMLPTQEVALWNIFLAVGGLAALLDFGFSNAFTRNITYVFSGVKTLKTTGYVVVNENDKSIDYGLLKSVVSAMRRYYGILSLVFLGIFFIISPFYFTTVLQKYTVDKSEVWIAWVVYGILVAYQLYTFYYSSLLIGRGLVKRSLQITIIGQTSRIVVSVICLLSGLGLLSLVIGQFTSDIVNRSLCYAAFYDKQMKQHLKVDNEIPVKEVMRIMTPNSVKIGITTIGSFFINKAVMLIAPLFLIPADIASFGTTKQMIDLIISLGGIWLGTYYPKITLHMVNNETDSVKRLYIKAKLNLIASFVICGAGLIVIGPLLLEIIHSKTSLLPGFMILVFLIVSFFDANQGMGSTILLTRNEVPFMKAVIFSGIAVLILLYLGLKFTSLELWVMILAPGIAQSVYQNWKWPLQVKRELDISITDYKITLIDTLHLSKHFKSC